MNLLTPKRLGRILHDAVKKDIRHAHSSSPLAMLLSKVHCGVKRVPQNTSIIQSRAVMTLERIWVPILLDKPRVTIALFTLTHSLIAI